MIFSDVFVWNEVKIIVYKSIICQYFSGFDQFIKCIESGNLQDVKNKFKPEYLKMTSEVIFLFDNLTNHAVNLYHCFKYASPSLNAGLRPTGALSLINKYIVFQIFLLWSTLKSKIVYVIYHRILNHKLISNQNFLKFKNQRDNTKNNICYCILLVSYLFS